MVSRKSFLFIHLHYQFFLFFRLIIKKSFHRKTDDVAKEDMMKLAL